MQELNRKQAEEKALEMLSLNETEMNEIIRDSYYQIKDILNFFMDHDERWIKFNAVWIIGTYLHHQFNSYPYLFFNAMKGSGKSRFISLICCLSHEGNLVTSPTEATLFRGHGTLGLDEVERIGSNESAAVRELLNASYKKGTKIQRMKKGKSLEGEKYEIEEFDTYRPIVMANIMGMDEVLESRCIVQILKKSDDNIKTRLAETFIDDKNITNIKNNLKKCRVCSEGWVKRINQTWNSYLINHVKGSSDDTTHYTHYTDTTNLLDSSLPTTIQFNKKELSFFNKIYESDIKGRNLELFLPIFYVASIIGDDVFKDMINLSKDVSQNKKEQDTIESYDVSLIDFVSQIDFPLTPMAISHLKTMFLAFLDDTPEEINNVWVGLALKRLNLILSKKRKRKGIEVILNVEKAKEMMLMFR